MWSGTDGPLNIDNLPRPSLLSEFKDWIDWQKGYRQASREIKDIEFYSYSTARVVASRDKLISSKPRSIHYYNGHSRKYAEVGARDAMGGMYRPERYESRDYILGWIGQVNKMMANGWRNVRFINVWEALKKDHKTIMYDLAIDIDQNSTIRD